MRSVQRGISAVFIVIAILGVTIAVTVTYFISSQNQQQKLKAINSFEECAKLYPVMESYPEQCNTPDGKHFTRQLSEEEKQKLNSSPSVSSLKSFEASPSPSSYPSPSPLSYAECLEKYRGIMKGIIESKNSFAEGIVVLIFDESISNNQQAQDFIKENNLEFESEPSWMPSLVEVKVPKGKEPEYACNFLQLKGVKQTRLNMLYTPQ